MCKCAGLFAYCSWATIGVMPAVAFLLNGIENIGIHIEQPMLVLPMRALAESARNTVDIVYRTALEVNLMQL